MQGVSSEHVARQPATEEAVETTKHHGGAKATEDRIGLVTALFSVFFASLWCLSSEEKHHGGAKGTARPKASLWILHVRCSIMTGTTQHVGTIRFAPDADKRVS
jgi:hypothetical protein